MRKSDTFLLSNDCLKRCSCFAGLDTLVPRVMKFCVTRTSTDFEPRTSATTTTAFTRFLDGAAFVTFGPDGHRRRRGCWHLYVSIGQRNKEENAQQSLFSHAIPCYCILGLTFAGLHAFRPSVSNIFAVKCSTVLEPRTTRGTTTDSARFPKRAALWTRHRNKDR